MDQLLSGILQIMNWNGEPACVGVSARKVFLMGLLAFVATSMFCRARRGLESLSIQLHVTEHGQGAFLLSLAEARNTPRGRRGSWRRHHCGPPSRPGSTTVGTCSRSLPCLRGAACFLPGVSEISPLKRRFGKKKCDGTKSTEGRVPH